MIRYLYANQLRAFPQLARSMFLDRADQFRTLLGWDVRGDGNGEERDKYDDRKPICVIWENVDGSQGGAMRLLPTVEGCMVNDHFLHLTDDFGNEFASTISTGPRVSTSDSLKVNMILDNMSIEVFYDDGKTVMTEIFFPRQAYTSLKINQGVPVIDIQANEFNFN